MTNLIIGIDGGGTKTEYLLSDLDGHVLNTVLHAPTSLSASGLGQAAFNLREGIRLLLEEQKEPDIAIMVMAVAGLDTMRERDAATQVFGEILSSWAIHRLVLINDGIAALVNATEQTPAIVLIGGTGASCIGRNQAGQTYKVSGLDYLLADEGSGYDAGRLSIRAAVQSYDGRGLKTKLEQTVFEHFHVTTASALKNEVYSPQITKNEVASFAKDCIDLAKKGDQVAQAIIDYCLDQLVLNVVTVAHQLNFHQQVFDLVVTGSFVRRLANEFTPKLKARLPLAKLITSEKTPAYGSLQIAQKILAGEDIKQFEVFD